MNLTSSDYRTWSVDTCLICDIKNNEPWVPFKLLFGEEAKSEILFENENFFVIADIGPIIEGHYLINYKKHVPSFAFSTSSIINELEELKQAIKLILKKTYGDVIFFEHGAKNFHRSGGCCIDHAHLHIVPLQIDILPFLQNDFSFQERDLNYITTLKNRKEYLYYESHDGAIYVAENDDTNFRIPTQYFRRVLATLSGDSTMWNWRDHVRYAEIFQTREKIVNAMNNFLKYKNLSSNVK